MRVLLLLLLPLPMYVSVYVLYMCVCVCVFSICRLESLAYSSPYGRKRATTTRTTSVDQSSTLDISLSIVSSGGSGGGEGSEGSMRFMPGALPRTGFAR